MFGGCSDVRWMFRCSMDVQMFGGCVDVRWMFRCSVDVQMFSGCSDVQWMCRCSVDIQMFGGCADVRWMFRCSVNVQMFIRYSSCYLRLRIRTDQSSSPRLSRVLFVGVHSHGVKANAKANTQGECTNKRNVM